jgi:transcriptional regulator with XRE-family HTH domain
MADTDREARERFAANIERLRRRDGLSVEDLAERAQIDDSELDEILRAESEATYTAVLLLAGALGVEPGALIEGIRWIPPRDGQPGRYAIDEADGGS